MKISAYIDTNIFIYAIFHHHEYGSICDRVLYDVQEGRIDGHGSYLVAIELLGAISKIDPLIAWNATKYYLAMNIKLHDLNPLVLSVAGLINTVINVRYDAIHLALMILNNVDTIITNDLDDWIRISENFDKISERLDAENYKIGIQRVKVISPNQYEKLANHKTS